MSDEPDNVPPEYHAYCEGAVEERAACVRRVREACPECGADGQDGMLDVGEYVVDHIPCPTCTPFVLAIEKGD